MAVCTFCGEPVFSSRVHHGSCWEKKATEVAEDFCDDYCRFNRMGLDEVELNERYCETCPMQRLIRLGR